jgi:hypothetical protein
MLAGGLMACLCALWLSLRPTLMTLVDMSVLQYRAIVIMTGYVGDVAAFCKVSVL